MPSIVLSMRVIERSDRLLTLVELKLSRRGIRGRRCSQITMNNGTKWSLYQVKKEPNTERYKRKQRRLQELSVHFMITID